MASKFLHDAARQAYRQWIKPWSPSSLARRRIHARAIANVKYGSKMVKMPNKRQLQMWWKQMHGAKNKETGRRTHGYLTPTILYDVLTGKKTHHRAMGHYFKTGAYNLPEKEAKRIVNMVVGTKGVPKNPKLTEFITHKKKPVKRDWLGVKRAISAKRRGKLKYYQARILRQQIGGDHIKFGDIGTYIGGKRPSGVSLGSRLSNYRMDRVRAIARAKRDYQNIDVPRMQFASGLVPVLGTGVYAGYRSRRSNDAARKSTRAKNLRKISFRNAYDSAKRKMRQILVSALAVAGVGGLVYVLTRTRGSGVRVSSRNVPSRHDSEATARRKIDSIVEESEPNVRTANILTAEIKNLQRKHSVSAAGAMSVIDRRNRILAHRKAGASLREDTTGKYGNEEELLDDDSDDRDTSRMLRERNTRLAEQKRRLGE